MAEDRAQELRRQIADCRRRLAAGQPSDSARRDLADVARLEAELAALRERERRAALIARCRHPG